MDIEAPSYVEAPPLYSSYGACIFDYVEISFDTFIWRYYGNGTDLPEYILSTGSSMTIRFHSDLQTTKTGFIAKWEAVYGE